MKLDQSSLLEVLTAPVQFEVPIYQRQYEWSEERIRTLWSDLMKIVDDPDRTHYMGSVIRESAETTGAFVQRYLVIDGQQRLTALTLLIAAIRDAIKERQLSGKETFENIVRERQDADEGGDDTRIHLKKLLRNNYISHKVGTQTYHKLVPTELNNDREVFENVVFNNQADRRKRHYRHYVILKNECITPKLDGFVSEVAGDKVADIAGQIGWLHQCLDALGRMQIAFITVDGRSDDVQQIFESINYKGEPLSVTDLIRNHLMSAEGIAPEEKRQIYENVWTPIEESLCSLSAKDGSLKRRSLLEGFFSAYVSMRRYAAIPSKEMFAVFGKIVREDRLSKPGVSYVKTLSELTAYARTYQYLNDYLNGDQPENVKAVVKRYSMLKFVTPMPLLLRYMGTNSEAYPSCEQLDRAFKVLESFFVRRALLGKSVKGMSDYFALLTKQFDVEQPSREEFAVWLQRRLQSVGTINKEYKELNFITDEEFSKEIQSARAYSNSRNATSFALVAIELLRNPGEVIANLESFDVEHVLPQDYEKHWLQDLLSWHKGVSEEVIREQVDLYGDTIGNLTLTAFNRKLQNFSFNKKRDYGNSVEEPKVGYKHSKVLICSVDLGGRDRWTFTDIKNRSTSIGAEIIRAFPYSAVS